MSLTASDLVLVTGAGGKVGRAVVAELLAHPGAPRVRTLTLSSVLPEHPSLSQVRDDIARPGVPAAVMQDVTRVVHLATCKEDPERIIDVAVGGLFGLLEEARRSATLQRFVLLSGDAALGHCVHPYDEPVPDDARPRPYPGCYALSKVLEEAMLASYQAAYDLDVCCLRVPWVMAEDDLRAALTFGPHGFGTPRWHELVDPATASAAAASGAVPLALDADGIPLRRNVIHLQDVVSALILALVHPAARQQVLNVAIEAMDYGAVAELLAASRGLPAVPVPTPFHSVDLDSSRARALLGWSPTWDLPAMLESAWTHERVGAREVRYAG